MLLTSSRLSVFLLVELPILYNRCRYIRRITGQMKPYNVIPPYSIMQSLTSRQEYSLMITNRTKKPDFASQITKILDKEPGLSVKELAERLRTNRQFMAGVLKVLEEHQEVSCRQVGPARIYFVHLNNKGTLNNGNQEI